MQAKDLRVEPPRRWNERLDGIPWLPRMIDKTRAAHAGTLGAYLFGQSPMDSSCLRVLGLRHRDFARIVAAARTDEDILAEIGRRDPAAPDRGRAWGDLLWRRHRVFLFLIDVDDGYARSLRPFKPLINLGTNVLTWAIKRVWPSRAVEHVR
jgi:Domain of unknown function (DUF5069)